MRWLTPTAFGQCSTAFAFVALFRLLPDFGMSYASSLAISREPTKAMALVGHLLGFQTVLSLLTVVLCLAVGQRLYGGVTWIAVVLLTVDLIAKALKSTLRWVLKALQRFGAEAVSLLLERLLILLLGIWSLASGYGVVGFVAVFAVLRLVDVAALWAFIDRRVLALRPSVDLALWYELLRRGLPFAYAGLMITTFFHVDAVMLEHMRGPQEVGWYRGPTQILEGLTLVPRILGYALIPTMASLHQRSPAVVSELYRRGSKYLLLAGLPLVVFGPIAGPALLRVVAGPQYGPSEYAAQLLLPAGAFMFLSNLGETTLACIDRWRAIVVASTFCLVLNVALNLVWIPKYGLYGASIATILTEAAYFIATVGALAHYGHRVNWWQVGRRPAVAAAFFGIALWGLRAAGLFGSTLGFVAAMLVAASVLLALTFALRIWDHSERDALRSLLRVD